MNAALVKATLIQWACPKCDHKVKAVRFHKALPSYISDCPRTEHLDLTCQQCHYTQSIPTMEQALAEGDEANFQKGQP